MKRLLGVCAAVAGLSAGVAVPSDTLAQADFSQCLARLETRARTDGVAQRTIDAVFPNVVPRQRVIRADRSQAEFVESFAAYLGRRVNPSRVTMGRELLVRHRDVLDVLTREYGVPGQYIVAFWGLETNYGGYLGDVSVFDSLSTLACDPRRSNYFTDEFINALHVVDSGHVEPSEMIGSWAGAMGQTQFMPSNYLRYAVDGDRDGRVDLWNSVDDALASAANFLSELGWRAGERWGREVLLPPDFDFSFAAAKDRPFLAEWRRLGVTDVQDQLVPALDMRAALIVPSGHTGPAFLVYDNFDVIMRWNRSEFFALTVGHLADRIAGAGTLRNPPPEGERITRDQLVRLQEYLLAHGYDGGPADGILGPQSRAALRALQRDRGLIADGFVSTELLDALGLVSE
jgi:membrane-bound lytic murein transglycosylase B